MSKTSFIKLISANKIYISCLHKFFNSFFVFSKGTTSTINKTRRLKCISGINLSTARKNLFLISFILYTQWNCIQSKTFNNGILLKGVLISKLLNKPFAPCCFSNLDFLSPHVRHFYCIINLPFFALKTFGFRFSVFFLKLTQ